MNPEQNGVSVRMNRMITETTCSMLYHGKLQMKFWAEAAKTAVYLRNLSPTVAVHGMTPYECWHGSKPDVNHLRIFGCNAYVHIPNQNSEKLNSKSLTCVFIGYQDNCKGYTFYYAECNEVFISRGAKVIENSFGNTRKNADDKGQDQ